ncbi:MAG: glycoside hydrolase 43 family protein [Lachnospiraceae bacterium]|nr:glycoside hydrolase 43 family protein [Lachnospiraceae bacterium]
MASNPILKLDYPDIDVIRVGDTYYMVSTTMYFMPGGVILRSYDLVHWEIASYVFDAYEDTPAARLLDGQNIYGQGMWAASLRHHNGMFYICFIANDTHKTYLYRSENIEGPWNRQYIEGFYHDCSLLFDDDNRVYLVYGNTDIYLTELKQDLTGPKEGGLSRLLVSDNRSKVGLGYEGSHIYKIAGKYYLFLIHWPNHGTRRRTEACFVADSLDGTFVGRDVVDDDMDYFNSGVAQGGIVDTPDGLWYAMLFQDYGALGRIPVLIPVTFQNGFPVFGHPSGRPGKIPRKVKPVSTRPGYHYEPLYGGDDFRYSPGVDGKIHLKKFWQWNHIPEESLWNIGMTLLPDELISPSAYHNIHCYQITSGKLCRNLTQASNTLTQRLAGAVSTVTVTLNGVALKDGDFAGLCALQGYYAFIGLTREEGKYFIVVQERCRDITSQPEKENYDSIETARISTDSPYVTLRLTACFRDMQDTTSFFYRIPGGQTGVKELDHSFQALGQPHKLYFTLDHFTGCRAGLFLYSTKETGGSADFADFQFEVEES